MDPVARRRLIWLGAVVLLAVLVVATTRSRPVPTERVELPEMISSDSVPDPRAVGMCARNRATGVVEGEIVGVVQREPEEIRRYRVRSREHAGAEYVMEGAMVQVVKCEDTATVALPTRRGRRAAR